ncbi:MAG: hypothetical protein LUD27_08400, partial [Clostridia bacterium]|nr:hypothetical protein [Clostridia bacterium]
YRYFYYNTLPFPFLSVIPREGEKKRNISAYLLRHPDRGSYQANLLRLPDRGALIDKNKIVRLR